MVECRKSGSLKGEIQVPGDKSISHRAVMLGSLAKGTTRITGFLQGADCLSTISCFEKMGVSIENTGDTVLVHGRGMRGLEKPEGVLDCGNSGTTMRLISGILSAQDFDVTLMPGNGCAPLYIQGRPLTGIHYASPVASAQVKSSVLLAGLYADGETAVTEPSLSRDHTERMLGLFGADIASEGTTARITPARELFAADIQVPGDISSAAYFIAAGLIVPGSQILIKNVGINPTRAGILEVCRKMGGDIRMLNRNEGRGEPTADLLVTHSSLKGTVIEGDIIPTLIDELPVIAAMACFAEGETIIRDASELKVKESNRIAVMAQNLTAMGAQVQETDDGLRILGGRPLHGAVIDSHDDHRIAMTFAVAALCSQGETKIQGGECVNISYPAFYKDLGSLIQ